MVMPDGWLVRFWRPPSVLTLAFLVRHYMAHLSVVTGLGKFHRLVGACCRTCSKLWRPIWLCVCQPCLRLGLKRQSRPAPSIGCVCMTAVARCMQSDCSCRHRQGGLGPGWHGKAMHAAPCGTAGPSCRWGMRNRWQPSPLCNAGRCQAASAGWEAVL
jgi:hypothetical protein